MYEYNFSSKSFSNDQWFLLDCLHELVDQSVSRLLKHLFCFATNGGQLDAWAA